MICVSASVGIHEGCFFGMESKVGAGNAEGRNVLQSEELGLIGPLFCSGFIGRMRSRSRNWLFGTRRTNGFWVLARMWNEGRIGR